MKNQVYLHEHGHGSEGKGNGNRNMNKYKDEDQDMVHSQTEATDNEETPTQTGMDSDRDTNVGIKVPVDIKFAKNLGICRSCRSWNAVKSSSFDNSDSWGQVLLCELECCITQWFRCTDRIRNHPLQILSVSWNAVKYNGLHAPTA